MADTGLTPLEILEISKVVAAVSLIDKGAFKADLDKLGAAKAELERMYGVLPDVKATQAARNTAEGLLVAEKARVAEHAVAMAEELQKVKEQQAQLKSALQAAEDERLKAISSQRKLDQERKDVQEAQAKRADALAAREVVLRIGEEDLAASQRKLAEKVKRIKETATA